MKKLILTLTFVLVATVQTLAGRYTSANVFAYGEASDAEKFTPRIGLSFDILSDFTVYGLYDQSFSPQFGVNFAR